MAAGHRSSAKGVQRLAVMLEQDGVATVDEVEPLRLVVGVRAVEEPPVDRIRAWAADPDVCVGEKDFPPHTQEGIAQPRVGQHAVGDEAVDHRGSGGGRCLKQVSGHPWTV